MHINECHYCGYQPAFYRDYSAFRLANEQGFKPSMSWSLICFNCANAMTALEQDDVIEGWNIQNPLVDSQNTDVV